MAEEEIKELAREYIDSCTKRAGFVILPENIKSDFIDLFVAGFMKCLKLKAGKPKWYKLSEKYPEADKLVRVRLMSGMEHICETCYYEPTEDEIGYGKLVITFYELNGEWVDDNDIIAWCEIPKYKEE